VRIVCGDETVDKSKEHVGSFDWAMIALGAAGGAAALLAVAAAATKRRRRRTELEQVTARGRTQRPETRIEVVAINDANPEHHGNNIEGK
jgi:hypothetical protein